MKRDEFSEREPRSPDPPERATSVQTERFLSDLAHDMRNLLEGLRLGLAADVASSTRSTRAMYHDVFQLVRKTENFLESLSVASSPRAGDGGTTDLSQLLEHTLASVAPLLETREIERDEPQPSVLVPSDSRRLRQILINLICEVDAALDPSAPLCLHLRGREARAVLRVGTRAGRFPGTVAIEDNDALRLSRALSDAIGARLDRASDASFEGFELTLSATEGSAGSNASKTPTRVLVVDDNADTANTLAMFLEMHGLECHVAYDGRTALETAERIEPDAVVLDLGLPDMDGYEVGSALRKMPQGGDLLLFALSGYGDAAAAERSQGAGFDRHLLKPIDAGKVLELISQSLHKA